MSLAAEPPARDLAVHFSGMVLAIALPAIFLAFCVLAYVVQPPTAQGRAAGRILDTIATGSTPARAAPPAAPDEGQTPASSGYGIDDHGIAAPR